MIVGIRPEEEKQLATLCEWASQIQEFVDNITEAYAPKNKAESQPKLPQKEQIPSFSSEENESSL